MKSPVASYLSLFAVCFLLFFISGCSGSEKKVSDAERPNILWIVSEDNGPFLGCYGDDFATTPNLDNWLPREYYIKMLLQMHRFAHRQGLR